MNRNKFFYLHIPKTAGSSMNKFLTSQFEKNEVLLHIESRNIFENEETIEKVKDFRLLSGHILLPQAEKYLKVFDERITFALFRNPLKQVVSHLAWVRKLGDIGEEFRLSQHTEQIQKIVSKMLDLDLSSAESLDIFIDWLEDEKIFLFHDTQTRYLCGSPLEQIKPNLLNLAMKNLNKIDYVGITERTEEFTLMVSYSLNWSLDKKGVDYINKNMETYGIDISITGIQKVLQRLIMNDTIIYRLARDNFIRKWHETLVCLEKDSWSGFSTVSTVKVGNELERRRNLENV